MTTTAQLKAAAANPANWKPVPASEAIVRNLREDAACEKVDKLIMALLDLVPDNLSWKALDICEHLITPNTETQEHLALAFELISLAPLAYHSQAQALLSELMLAAGRHVVSLNTLIGKRLNGWWCA
ncbi:MAG: hypothetical protein IV090_24580 [Candidatus Sericytochromatia bacterium]|nr:hypothetical protein [Candidatus Sericytochromatia bacterium]